MEEMEPTVQEILDHNSLRWIFVGGKGGVGKTTTSCCLSILLSQRRESVLLISTDPAHNLSDAFNQKIGSSPTQINGFLNLYAMEVDSKIDPQDMSSALGSFGDVAKNQLGIDPASLVEDIGMTIPGIDEAMAFSEVLKIINTMNFKVVVFDTAPTGHTLRLLGLPSMLDKAISKFSGIQSKFSGMMSQFQNMFGMNISEEQMRDKWSSARDSIKEVNEQFKNPDATTFVCVCIPEFLSLYETERLVQELGNFEIDTHTIVVNQVLFPEKGRPCSLCNARETMQKKYIEQLHLLYSDFHIVTMPLMREEIRGIPSLSAFSKFLIEPYVGPNDQNNNNS